MYDTIPAKYNSTTNEWILDVPPNWIYLRPGLSSLKAKLKLQRKLDRDSNTRRRKRYLELLRHRLKGVVLTSPDMFKGYTGEIVLP